MNNQMLLIYMEEVIHSMTAAAIEADPNTEAGAKAISLKTRLIDLQAYARNNLTWKDFLPEESSDKEKEEENAKKLYEYIFQNKNTGEHEFVAKALTIPEFIRALKKHKFKDKESESIWDKIEEFFIDVLTFLANAMKLKQPERNMYESIVNLAFALGEVNGRAINRTLEKSGGINLVTDIVNRIDDEVADALNKARVHLIDPQTKKPLDPIPEDAGYLEKTKWVTKFVGLSIVNENYRKTMGMCYYYGRNTAN